MAEESFARLRVPLKKWFTYISGHSMTAAANCNRLLVLPIKSAKELLPIDQNVLKHTG